MSTETAEIVAAIGRLLLGGLFVHGGIHHFRTFTPIAGAMSARGVPFPRATLAIGSLFQIICGALFIFGVYVTWAALGLVVFTIAASAMLVNFWDMTGDARASALQSFYANLAIIGGLLIAAATAS